MCGCVSGYVEKGKRNLVFHVSVVMISSCTDDDSARVHLSDECFSDVSETTSSRDCQNTYHKWNVTSSLKEKQHKE